MHPIFFEASITGLFRILLIVFTVYIVFKIFFRFIMPSILRKYVNDFQQRFTEENQHSHEEQIRKKEGEISIKYVNKDKNPDKHPDDGDYIEYEEIK